jgi:hypothetical protein
MKHSNVTLTLYRLAFTDTKSLQRFALTSK